MSNKPTHNICIAENYKSGEEEKTYFTNVGSAWLKDTGTVTCELRQGIALTGRFVLVKPKEK